MFINIKNNIPSDCYVLTISKALNIPYEIVRLNVSKYEASWGKYLLENGFEKIELPAIPRKKRMTVKELTKKDKSLIIAVCFGHILHIHNGDYYDETDTGELNVLHYYKKKVAN